MRDGAASYVVPKDPGWPCIQRLVPKISAGMMWAGPPVEKLGDAWRENERIRGLAEKLAARRTQMEDAKAAIKAFASNLGQDKDRKLSLLFVGALALINTERADIISGIRRYSERQHGLAERIEGRAAEIQQIPADGSEASWRSSSTGMPGSSKSGRSRSPTFASSRSC